MPGFVRLFMLGCKNTLHVYELTIISGVSRWCYGEQISLITLYFSLMGFVGGKFKSLEEKYVLINIFDKYI